MCLLANVNIRPMSSAIGSIDSVISSCHRPINHFEKKNIDINKRLIQRISHIHTPTTHAFESVEVEMDKAILLTLMIKSNKILQTQKSLSSDIIRWEHLMFLSIFLLLLFYFFYLLFNKKRMIW